MYIEPPSAFQLLLKRGLKNYSRDILNPLLFPITIREGVQNIIAAISSTALCFSIAIGEGVQNFIAAIS